MIQRLARLKRRADFLRVAAVRSKWVTPGLILQMAPGTGPDDRINVGFTCSRKVGGAVQRNRARRRLKAAADAILPEAASTSHDYVIIGRPETLTRPFDQLLDDLHTAVTRLEKKLARQAGTSQ